MNGFFEDQTKLNESHSSFPSYLLSSQHDLSSVSTSPEIQLELLNVKSIFTRHPRSMEAAANVLYTCISTALL